MLGFYDLLGSVKLGSITLPPFLSLFRYVELGSLVLFVLSATPITGARERNITGGACETRRYTYSYTHTAECELNWVKAQSLIRTCFCFVEFFKTALQSALNKRKPGAWLKLHLPPSFNDDHWCLRVFVFTTALLSSCHSFSVVLRSGIWLGHYNTFFFLFLF